MSLTDDILMHYGMPRRSGRYPWGSGDNPYQHSGDFLSRVEELKKSNFTFTDTGHISGLCTLSGKLTCFGSLSGKLSAVIDFNAYSGEYEVVPNAFNTQVLPTANKVLKKDIIVQKVPYFETSNNYDGVTVYIAEEVNQNA